MPTPGRAACLQDPSTQGLKPPRLYPRCPLVASRPAQPLVALYVHIWRLLPHPWTTRDQEPPR